jgi:hypothetical protein
MFAGCRSDDEKIYRLRKRNVSNWIRIVGSIVIHQYIGAAQRAEGEGLNELTGMRVIATRTSQPARCRPRRISMLLYAAIPPDTPSATCFSKFPGCSRQYLEIEM